MTRLAAIAVAFTALACSASAELVARAEDGILQLQLGAPLGLDQPVYVNPNEIAWSEHIRPERVVRTTSVGAERPAPLRAAGIPSGAIMYAYALRGGYAYCPLINPDVRRMQCYRDFDGDGSFDGSYVTFNEHIDSTLLPGGLRGLTGMPHVTYEAASPDEGPVVSGDVIFIGFASGSPRFRIRIEQEWLEGGETCQLDEGAQCVVYGLRLRVLPLGGERARIEFVDAASVRRLHVCFNSAAPGNPCR
jgi:hypothetical protein